jgi:trehalose 6-phosphate synthase
MVLGARTQSTEAMQPRTFLSLLPASRAARGEQLIVVANRAPCTVERDADGQLQVTRKGSGVVNALEALMRSRPAVWIAEDIADAPAASQPSVLPVRCGDTSYRLHRVFLDALERRGYYDGFANSGLWPLCHRTSVEPLFYATDFQAYERVNRLFADAVSDEARGPSPTVFVQDYHLTLAPRFIRKQLPAARIASFWHIPWPRPERLEICPWSQCLLDGLLACDLVGLQTSADRRHFFECVARLAHADVDEDHNVVTYGGRQVQVGVYPASIAWPGEWTAAPAVPQCRSEVRRELGLADEVQLAVGVDRLDYTKGLEQKFLAVERMLERRRSLVGRFALVQCAEPTRASVPTYRDVRIRVLETANRINRRFSGPGPGPIILREGHHSPAAIARLFRAADACYVGSLHDGMNLVSKEFICSRDDHRGVLLLSAYAGASEELTDAVAINPYDVDASAASLAYALAMPPQEQAQRMRRLRQRVAAADAARWGSRILVDLAAGPVLPSPHALTLSANDLASSAG